MDNLYMDNLDIYNTLNADTEQGTSFLDYKRQYAEASGNNHDLLAVSSSPGIDSIIEALDGSDSISSYQNATQQSLNIHRAEFNRLLSEYTTAYNSYISSIRSNTSSNISSNKSSDLQNLNTRLLTLARTIANEINLLKTMDGNLRNNIQDQAESIIDFINDLENQQYILNNKPYHDVNSLDGEIETSTLTVNSNYLQYIIYFLISLILIVFIFNIMINPDADVMKSVFLLVALFTVYFISRWINK